MPDPLGQHFLRSTEAVQRLLDAAHVKPTEHVLDAGAGDGSITQALSAAVGAHGRVTAVELDAALADRLRALSLANVVVVEGDLLTVPLPPKLDAVVANPPYRILPPLLRRLFAHGFGRAVLVMPQELADRLTAAPGSEPYGKLTVQMGARGAFERAFFLPRKAFEPPPEVASAVVRVTPRPLRPDAELALLDTLVEMAWEQPRRGLRYGLSGLAGRMRLPTERVTAALDELDAAKTPPTEVPVRTWERLAGRLAFGTP